MSQPITNNFNQNQQPRTNNNQQPQRGNHWWWRWWRSLRHFSLYSTHYQLPYFASWLTNMLLWSFHVISILDETTEQLTQPMAKRLKLSGIKDHLVGPEKGGEKNTHSLFLPEPLGNRWKLDRVWFPWKGGSSRRMIWNAEWNNWWWPHEYITYPKNDLPKCSFFSIKRCANFFTKK